MGCGSVDESGAMLKGHNHSWVDTFAPPLTREIYGAKDDGPGILTVDELIDAARRVPAASDAATAPCALDFVAWLDPCINKEFGGFTGSGGFHGGVHYYRIELGPNPGNNIWGPVAGMWRQNAIFRCVAHATCAVSHAVACPHSHPGRSALAENRPNN